MSDKLRPNRHVRRATKKGAVLSRRALPSREVREEEAHVSEGETEPTHDVNPLHQVLENGVRFNVQTVPSLGKPLEVLTVTQTVQWVGQCATQACKNAIDQQDNEAQSSRLDESNFDRRRAAHPKVEQYCVLADTLVKHPARSLMQICLAAFAGQYPLVLSPDHVWLAIAYGAAKHIDKNAAELRARFVSFKGKKTLKIRKDNAVLGNTPVHEWERDVFRQFSEQIRQYIGNDIHQLLTAPFSTTSKAEMAATEITLMAATTQYFACRLISLSGIPSLELEGTLEDWMAVRRRAERLHEVLLPEFAQKWLPNLLPVLDEFVAAFKGNVNHAFWQRMVKKYQPALSGASAVVSGWINNLYPYLADGSVNPHMKPWTRTSQYHGPNPEKFPNIVSSVAVNWRYFNIEMPLHFHAGYLGMTQDADTLALRPYIGWIVTHDPPKDQEQC